MTIIEWECRVLIAGAGYWHGAELVNVANNPRIPQYRLRDPDLMRNMGDWHNALVSELHRVTFPCEAIAPCGVLSHT